MFDGLLDLFDRDRSRSTTGKPRRRGLRGMIDRLADDHDDDDRDRERPARRHDDDMERPDRASRHRQHDQFDWDD